MPAYTCTTPVSYTVEAVVVAATPRDAFAEFFSEHGLPVKAIDGAPLDGVCDDCGDVIFEGDDHGLLATALFCVPCYRARRDPR